MPLIIGNWKMNPRTMRAAKQLFVEVRNGVKAYKEKVAIVVAPPFLYLSEMERLAPNGRIALASQDLFYEQQGAYTGEVSGPMLRSVGVTYAVIGHSERRALGETDEDVARKVLAAQKDGLIPVLCIGEEKRNAHGDHFNVVEKQLRTALARVPKTKASRLVIAYEPIWAIGTGETATSEDIEEMRLFIQKLLADHFDRKASNSVRILYGGSVNKKNAGDILVQSGVDGFLVGGASLRSAEFIEIIKLAAHHANS